MISYAEHKRRAWLGILVGMGLIFMGARSLSMPFLLAPLLVLSGVWLTSKSFSRLVRIQVVEQTMERQRHTQFRETFERATLARQIFWLLLAVAEVDGRPLQEERELVRRFLLERFVDPITSAELAEWEAQRIPPEQVIPLVWRLRGMLANHERETLFAWCCLVAFADGRFASDEHRLLQDIARELGLGPAEARRIFMRAKQSHLGQTSEPRGFKRTSRRPPRAAGPVRSRDEALQVLGLGADASVDAVRKRHRQLVKQYHPDRHAHLGPIAAAEASARFRQVQAAYELLQTTA